MTNDKTERRNKTVHILMVEDDDVDAHGLERAFKRARIANPLQRAQDGLHALAMLRGEDGYKKIPHPYFLLVDINMPRMGGIEFITELRKDPALKSAIVFVLTTSKHDEDMTAAYNLNIAGYIVKENAGDDFMRLVELLDSYWRVVEIPT